MVRVWRRQSRGGQEWIGRVEHIRNHQIKRFHDPEALIAYLREQFAPAAVMVQRDTPDADVARHSTKIASGVHDQEAYEAVDPLDDETEGSLLPSDELPKGLRK